MAQTYDSDAIEVLKDLEPVKKRPGMYTDVDKPNHLVQEVVDNSVDEAMAGHASKIEIILGNDGFITVSDNGRGMPVSLHPTEKISGVEVILEKLHAGGKFSNKNYDFSGGLHGVGISVVNALSSVVEVFVKREGKTYYIKYNSTLKEGALSVLKEGKVHKSDTGTAVRFKPDPQYFNSINIKTKELMTLLKGKAILCPGLEIHFVDQIKGEDVTFLYETGLQAFIDEQDNIDEAIGGITFIGEGSKEEPPMNVSWGCYFHPENQMQLAFTNLIPTIQGGTHVNAFRQGLFEGLSEYVKLHSINTRKVTFNSADVSKNLNFVVSLKMQDPIFSGQTKEKLSSRTCASFITGQIKDSFSLYLSNNVDMALELVEAVVEAASHRLKKSKSVKRKEIGKRTPLPGKLQDCESNDLSETELFVVEGDSAGGSAQQGRNRTTQAIMPLRGKILNTWEIDALKASESGAVSDIAAAIGVDLGSDDLSDLRYGKICILADADSDGLHIATLFAALMLAHFPALIRAGHLYVAMPPLYRIDVGKKVFYALDDNEKSEILQKIKNDNLRGEVNVQRFKGLGEMNPDQLAETALDPVTRRLVQLTISDEISTQEMFDMLLVKKNSRLREAWISEKGNIRNIVEK
jgi:topoisomerase-4 subunit B